MMPSTQTKRHENVYRTRWRVCVCVCVSVFLLLLQTYTLVLYVHVIHVSFYYIPTIVHTCILVRPRNPNNRIQGSCVLSNRLCVVMRERERDVKKVVWWWWGSRVENVKKVMLYVFTIYFLCCKRKEDEREKEEEDDAEKKAFLQWRPPSYFSLRYEIARPFLVSLSPSFLPSFPLGSHSHSLSLSWSNISVVIPRSHRHYYTHWRKEERKK